MTTRAQWRITANNAHLMTSFILFMEAAIVDLSRNNFATEESSESPCNFLEDWNNSTLSLFRWTAALLVTKNYRYHSKYVEYSLLKCF